MKNLVPTQAPGGYNEFDRDSRENKKYLFLSIEI
jgi:hypothetical protein